jgi:hypothetical protein
MGVRTVGVGEGEREGEVQGLRWLATLLGKISSVAYRISITVAY